MTQLATKRALVVFAAWVTALTVFISTPDQKNTSLRSQSYFREASNLTSVTAGQKEQQLHFAVLVLSSCWEADSRTVARNTWLNLLPPSSPAFRTRALFVIGLGTTTQGCDDEQLAAEKRRYGDLLEVQTSETYNSITFKVFSAFWYLSQRYRKMPLYTLKTDMDTFVRLDAVRRLLNFSRPVCLYWGYFVYLRPSITKDPADKWYMRPEDYPWHDPPRYMAGSCYIISEDQASTLVERSQSADFRWPFPLDRAGLFEDAAVGTVLNGTRLDQRGCVVDIKRSGADTRQGGGNRRYADLDQCHSMPTPLWVHHIPASAFYCMANATYAVRSVCSCFAKRRTASRLSLPTQPNEFQQANTREAGTRQAGSRQPSTREAGHSL